MTADLQMVLVLGQQTPARQQQLDMEMLIAYVRRAGVVVRSVIVGGALRDRGLPVETTKLTYWHVSSRLGLSTLIGAVQRYKFVNEMSINGVGGRFSDWNSEELLRHIPQIDFVVYGECERTLVSIAKRVVSSDEWNTEPGIWVRHNGRITKNPPRPLVEDLDELESAAPDFVKDSEDRYTRQVMTGRGCNSDCQYCGLQTSYLQAAAGRTKFWRMRPAGKIVDEIAFYKKNFNFTHFEFNSYVFGGYGEEGILKVRELACELIERNLGVSFSFVSHPGTLLQDRETMRLLLRAGLYRVNVGVDSCLDRVLEMFQVPFSTREIVNSLRVLADEAIPFKTSYIFFDPYLRLEELRHALRTLREWREFYKHNGAPYSFILDQQILNTVLQVEVHMPLYKKLCADGLAQAPSQLDGKPIVSFACEDTGMVYMLHRMCSKGIMTRLRPVLFANAKKSGIEHIDEDKLDFFPLDLLEEATNLVETYRHADVEGLYAQLETWSATRLAAYL